MRTNSYLFFAMFLATSCASSQYQIKARDRYRIELEVSPDRMVLECEKLEADGDDDDRYGFMIRILDEENTAITAIQGNIIDKASCDERLSKIGRILKTGSKIYFAGIGDIDEKRASEDKLIRFPKHGPKMANGRVLQFGATANEHGLCFDAYSADDKPCPRSNVPIKK